MKSSLIIVFLSLGVGHFALGQARPAPKPINPTGSYRLVSHAKFKNGDVYGYDGHIEVKLLDSSRVVISFFVTKGMPSYNSGSFIDTLLYHDNQATYKTQEDSTCAVTFRFLANGIQVVEKAADYNFGCGFGHAVVADGFYKKISARIPQEENFQDQ